MNGFKLLAVGAFLCSGTSFCHAQINILENSSETRSILVRNGDDRFQPAPAADLTRQNVQAEITESPSDQMVRGGSDLIIDGQATSTQTPDPTSLPVAHGQPNVIDQILRNGVIAQTPHSAQVPIAWPMQQVDNPTARMMMVTACTQGLWDSYPSERAAECARMYQHLAKSRHAHGCSLSQHGHCQHAGNGCGCASCGVAKKPVNRYAPAACDSVAANQNSQSLNYPKFQSLLAPEPTVAQPLTETSPSSSTDSKENVAQLPGLIR